MSIFQMCEMCGVTFTNRMCGWEKINKAVQGGVGNADCKPCDAVGGVGLVTHSRLPQPTGDQMKGRLEM